MCETFFLIYGLATVVLVVLLVLLCYILRKHKSASEARRQSTGLNDSSIDIDVTAYGQNNNNTSVNAEDDSMRYGSVSEHDEQEEQIPDYEPRRSGNGSSSSSSSEDYSDEKDNVIGLGELCENRRWRFKTRESIYFVKIMILILLCLITRCIFLAVIFVPESAEFQYNLWTDDCPLVFKLLTVVYLCKYKVNTYYVAVRRRAKAWVRLTFLALDILSVVVTWIPAVLYCTQIEQKTWLLLVITPELTFNLGISVLSLTLTVVLSRKMSFGALQARKKWLYLMEVFIQMIIAGRCVILALTNVYVEPDAWIVIFSTYLIVTELVPFFYLVFCMIERLKVYKRGKNLLKKKETQLPPRDVSLVSTDQMIQDILRLPEEDRIVNNRSSKRDTLSGQLLDTSSDGRSVSATSPRLDNTTEEMNTTALSTFGGTRKGSQQTDTASSTAAMTASAKNRQFSEDYQGKIGSFIGTQ